MPGPIAVETAIHFVIEESGQPEAAGQSDSRDDGGTESVAEPAADAPAAATGPPSHAGDVNAPVVVEGQALERGTRRPIPGVIVSLQGVASDAITDADGRFFFHGVAAGSYDIIAVAEGFDRFRRFLTVAPGEKVELRLWMRPRGGNPYETVVEGEREVLEVTRRTLRREQLTSVPGTFGDPIRVIQSLPGLARTPFVTGFLVIRGSNPDDSGIYIDGHRVPLIFHFLGGPSILNPEFLDSIDLYPGGFPARFGRAIGGIVSVETRSAKSDGVHGSADIDILDAGGYVRFPVGEDVSVAVAGRRSYLDFLLGFFLPEPDEGETLIVTPAYWDWQARVDWDLHEEGRASLFVLSSSDRLDVVQSDSESSLNLGSAIDFTRVIATYERPLGSDLRLTLSPAWGRDRVSFSGGQRDAAAAFTGIDVVQDSLSYRMRVRGALTPTLLVDGGLDLESRVTRYDLLVPQDQDIPALGGAIDIDPERLERAIDLLGVAAYVDLAWDVTKRLRLIPGLRIDGYLLAGEPRSSIDPRLVGRFRVNEQWLAKGYVGLFHQAPQPEGFDPEFGNPELELERAIHTGVGAEWQPLEHWTLDGEVYLIDRDDLAFSTDEAVIDEVSGRVSPLNFINSGRGDTVGLEALVRREVTENLYGWLSYTLSFSRQQRDRDEDYSPTFFDQRHILNAVASYKTNRGWELGGRFRLASGSPDTPIVGATFDADSGTYDAVTGARLSDRRDTFHQLDVRAERTWLFNTWQLGAYLDIQNVYRAENVEAVQYDYRFAERAPVTGVPFLPTLGVRGQW